MPTPNIRQRPRPQSVLALPRTRGGGDRLRPVTTVHRPLPADLRPAPVDELDAEIDAALAEGRPVDMASAFPDPADPIPPGTPEPQIGPGPQVSFGSSGNQSAYHTVTPGTAPPAAPSDDGGVIPQAGPDNMSPAQRLRHVGVIAPTYLDEYRLRLLHRLMMRRLPLDVIATQLQCSVATIQQMKIKLRKRLAQQALSLDVYDVAGETVAFFNEIRGLAMKQVDNNTLHVKDRQYAMRIAMEAQNDVVRFLSSSGYFDHTPYIVDRGKSSDPKQTEVDQTLSMLAAVMSPDTSETDIGSFFASDAMMESEYDGVDPHTDVL